MTSHRDWMPTITELTERLFDNELSSDEQGMLSQLLSQGPQQRSHYLAYANLLITLERRGRVATPPVTFPFDDVLDSPPPLASVISEVPTGRGRYGVDASVSAPSAIGFLSTTLHGTTGFLSSGWPLAYLVATVVLIVGCLVAHLTPKSHAVQVVHRSPPARSRSLHEPATQFVGRITGMVDCRWARGRTPLSLDGAVPVGREIKLESGLMEITYDTGAKVILQGPVTYEVESGDGGYLALGKLTAKVEKGESGRRKAEESNPQSLIPNPASLAANHYPLFTIKTPTVTVTDLGTEFGVEVKRSGNTTLGDVRVFSGQVVVNANHAGDGSIRPVSLVEGQSLCFNGTRITVEKDVDRASDKGPLFVRSLKRSFAAYIDAVVADRPVAFWHLSERNAESPARDSVGPNHGKYLNFAESAFGRPSIWTDDLETRNSAVQFDGVDSYVAIPDSPDLRFGEGNFTISLWIKSDSVDTGKDRCLLCKRARDGGISIFWKRDDTVYLSCKSSGQTASLQLASRRQLLARRYWYHVVFSVDRTAPAESKVYLNGVNDTSLGSVILSRGSLDFAGADLLLGKHTTEGLHFDGWISGVAVFRAALPKERIRLHFRSVNDSR